MQVSDCQFYDAQIYDQRKYNNLYTALNFVDEFYTFLYYKGIFTM